VTIIFCPYKLRLHRNRAADNASEYDFLVNYSASIIYSKLEDLKQKPKNILELGARKGSLSKLLLNEYPHSNIITCEIAENAIRQNPAHIRITVSEEELCFKDNSFDLILSSLNFHWINDVPKFLLRIRNILSNEGVFIASFIGGNSLKTLRTNFVKAEISIGLNHIPHLSPMIEHSTITSLLQNIGFKNIVTETEIVEVEYKNVFSLMNDLRSMGESAAFKNSSNYALSKQLFQSLNNIYNSNFTEYFEIITITVRK
jgi:NADH dehydrogenase [ubiquinone] 1 alpha subcomplex assembly factor 5